MASRNAPGSRPAQFLRLPRLAAAALAFFLLPSPVAPSAPASAQTAPATTAAGTSTAAAAVAATAPSTAAAPATSAATPSAATAITTAPTARPVNEKVRTENANALLLQQIAKLPPLTGTGVDVPKRSTELIDHLNAVLRYYRAAIAPVQKAGEPSDVLYAQQSSAQATEIAETAFQAAKNEAALLNKIAGGSGTKTNPAAVPAADHNTAQSEAQRLSAVQAQAAQQVSNLQAQEAAIAAQLATARGKAIAPLQQQQSVIQGQLELQQAMVEALSRINTFSEAQTSTGLAGQIARLEQSAPELAGNTKAPATPVLENLANAHDAGVATQAEVLFQLLTTLHDIDAQTEQIDALSKQADDLRTPIVKILHSTVAQGQALAQTPAATVPAPPPTPAAGKASPTAATAPAISVAQQLAATHKQFDQLTATFQVLSSAALPLSQEVVLLEGERGTLTTWRATVDSEYKQVLRDLLVRVIMIGIALGILALASNLWARATVRYVGDLRRRRQLLFVRRAVIGFLSGLVLIFGFVTQFSSLATFAGFISAGIAVGLQSILLSIAAYFFIVGRYGVRVGDRITVTGVTGDVIEVGLVRFYMMELVGTGTELHSTGRVAVFANSVLFQTGTPIYKQMPGTEYAWHELTAKLNNTADIPATSDAILQAVNSVYAGYKTRIEAQHQQVESWSGTALPGPKVESRLQLVDGGLQFAVLFPVELSNPVAADQQIAESLVSSLKTDGPLKAGLTELPVIKAAVKT